MKTDLTIVIAIILIAASLAWCAESRAGPFLDLAIGAHLTDYDSGESLYTTCSVDVDWDQRQGVQTCHKADDYLSGRNPVFAGRLGWQTKQYDFIGKSKLRGQVFIEHISSAAHGHDRGLNFGMIGVRIE